MSPDRLPPPLRPALPLLFWLAVWQLASMAADAPLLLPGPRPVARALASLCVTLPFWQSVGASVLRILLGLLLGSCAGILFALASCAGPWADMLLSPAMRVVRATPVVSFILLVLLWTSRSAVPGVISGLTVLPVLWDSVSTGIRQTDPLLLEMARAYRFGRRKTLRLVYAPSVFPYFSAGLNTAMGLAWKSGVAAEVICHPRAAVGTQIYNAKVTLETADLFAWTAAVIALSFCLERLMRRLLRRPNRKERIT